ncbi:vWA domain-containing protein, partial [Nonomuraea longicatena]
MTYERQTHARVAAARLWAAHRAPYLASAVFALNPVILDAGPQAPAADADFRAFPADTRWNLYVEPGIALATPVEELGWWMLHHVGHLVRGHAARSPARPGNTHAAGAAEGRWNQAADAEINDDLEAAGLPGPAGVISPGELGLPVNRTAEEYAPMLEALAEEMGRGGGAPAAAIDCGSAADGHPRPYENGGTDEGLTELDRELLERSLAAGMHERAAARSEVPAGWRRWAEERLRPSVDWRARLGALIRRGLSTTAGRVDFSYSRPSRRAGAYTAIVPPSLVRPVPDTVLVIDTSGSVTDEALKRLLTEVGAIVDGVSGPRRLRALCCDVRPHPVQTVRRAADIELVGGGGTDLRAGLAAAM